ncbi:MAG: four helix bundle protein [bacterium]|nr:four helix bundle protein [bacterium]
MEYKNKNRGYQQLRVWQHAIGYYTTTCRTLRLCSSLPQRLFLHQIATCDSIHRNIAEGYARRSIREYINYLYIALGSLAESVSALHAITPQNKLTVQITRCLTSRLFVSKICF